MMRNGTASTESEKAIQLARAQAEKVFPAADETQKRESQATALVKLALEQAILFHNGEDCFARIPAGDHDETYLLKSRGVRRWLTHLYFEREQTAPGGDAVRCAIETLAGHALFEGEANKT
jgi:hypothetical protein